MWHNFLQKLVHFLDSKLDKYRPKTPDELTPAKQPPDEPPYSPQTITDFINVIKRTPHSVLSTKDRARIAAIMNFDDRKVKDLMAPKSQIVFVGHKEVLGPLVLDKLYKSGFTNFPVIDNKEKVLGVIHTEALNTLEIKKTDRAEKYIDHRLNYLHINDSLKFAVEEIERTNSYYFLVLDDSESLAGCFTIQMLLDYLLN